MPLITPQAARCDGLWLSVHTDDRNRYYCWGCVRFCRSCLACRSCSLSRHSNYCWHFRDCCQLSFILVHFLPCNSPPILAYCHQALFSTQALCTFDSARDKFFLFSFTLLSVSRFSFVICRILIFRSASYQVQWNWLLIRKPNQTVVLSSVEQSFLLVDKSPANMMEEVATCQAQHWTLEMSRK